MVHPSSQEPLLPSRGKGESNFIPDHIYTAQSRWYETVMQKYGLPLDSRHLYTKSDWEFQAAAVASKKTRSQILDRVATWLNETSTDRPFTDLYNTEGDGGFPGKSWHGLDTSQWLILHRSELLRSSCGGIALCFLDSRAGL